MEASRIAAGRVKFFSATERITHWVHAAAFLVLLGTGLVLYVPQLSALVVGEAGIFMRMLHRVAAVIFILIPIYFIIFDHKGFFYSLKKIFSWSGDDIKWFKAAPAYYFKGDESKMPPQDKYNTGQKLFSCIVVIGCSALMVTGLIMWFGGTSTPNWLFKWSMLVHDVSTIAVGVMFLVHFYLPTMHPIMMSTFDSIILGTMSEEHVKHHHAKWYEEIKGAE